MRTAYEIAQTIDHTLLKTNATYGHIINLANEANRYHFKSICIPPYYLKEASKHLSKEVLLCTVIGFPLGYMNTQAKIAECQNALNLGAHEIDMVININSLKNKKYNYSLKEISQLAEICHDNSAILKVIIETSELSLEEKKKACEICTEAKADFVKTSTGFSSSGAKIEDIQLMRESLPSHMKIKASGGIRTLKQAIEFLDAGASRLGLSAGVSILKELSSEL